MSDDSSEILSAVLQELKDQLEDSGLALQQRAEWKDARVLCAGMAERRQTNSDAPDAVTDLVREAEAARDLLSIARSEVDHEAAMAEQGRTQRLAEDLALLASLDKQCDHYRALVLASFVVPIFFITWPPASRFVLLALIPVVMGSLQTRGFCEQFKGRIWLVLQARVDEGMARVRMLHGTALGAAVAALLWFVVALMSVEARLGV